MQQPPWMAVAWAELGQAERPGAAVNARILDYFAALGHTIADDETAWCAAFVGVCLERAGIASTRSLMARSYLDWGRPVPEPTLGAIAVLSRGPDPSLGHVGFVLGTTASGVVLLGGNQSDAVGVAHYDRGRVLGYRDAPAGDAAPVVEEDLRHFTVALAHVLDMEGGWSDDPFDPGGPTNKGITLREYALARGLPLTPESRPVLEGGLRSIPDALVHEVYLARVWRPARCADLPPPVALMHFDAAVNHGVGGAARLLQEALGVGIDGEIGPITLRAAYTLPVRATLRAYANARRRRYRALPHFWRFGRGWLRRVDATLALALRQPMPPRPQAPRSPPAQETWSMPESNFPPPSNDVETPGPTKWWGQSVTIWGTLLTALSTVLPVLGPALGIDLTPDLIQQLGGDVALLIQAIGGLAGTLLAIFGRVRATTLIQRRPVRLRL